MTSRDGHIGEWSIEGMFNPSGHYAHALLDFALNSNHLPTQNSSPPKKHKFVFICELTFLFLFFLLNICRK